ncbi:MAG: CpaE family protein [Rhodothalassiaceae bacterium]
MAGATAVAKQASEEREPFGAYICDTETAELLEVVAREQGWRAERIHKGGIANAVRSLSVMRSPEFLIVDLAESEEPLSDINALADVCEPGTVVLALGSTNDVRLYRDLLASGIHDYLLKPLDATQLRESTLLALSAMTEQPEAAPEPEAGETQSIAIIGTRGGVGASTIASGLSWILAEENKARVALLDLDIQFGTAALTFDLEPGRGLCDALENPNRVDSLFIERATLKVTDHLSVLGAEAPLGDPIAPDPGALVHLHDTLADSFDRLVVDLPRSMANSYPGLLESVNDVIAVTELTLAATRDTIRLLAFVKDKAPSARVHLVVNRVPPPAQQEVSEKDFAASIERDIDFRIPLDRKSALLAAKKGRPLPQAVPGAKPVRELRALAAALAGEDSEGSGGSLLKKLFRKGS